MCSSFQNNRPNKEHTGRIQGLCVPLLLIADHRRNECVPLANIIGQIRNEIGEIELCAFRFCKFSRKEERARSSFLDSRRRKEPIGSFYA